jgi:hypothetical protein
MPVNRIALLFGRVLRDVLLLVAGVIIALPAERDPCTLQISRSRKGFGRQVVCKRGVQRRIGAVEPGRRHLGFVERKRKFHNQLASRRRGASAWPLWVTGINAWPSAVTAGPCPVVTTQREASSAGRNPALAARSVPARTRSRCQLSDVD